MKDYLVTSDYGQCNNMWIVLAKDVKDAIEQVYQAHVVPMNENCKRENKEAGYKLYRLCRKDELHAKSIGSLHNSDIFKDSELGLWVAQRLQFTEDEEDCLFVHAYGSDLDELHENIRKKIVHKLIFS